MRTHGPYAVTCYLPCADRTRLPWHIIEELHVAFLLMLLLLLSYEKNTNFKNNLRLFWLQQCRQLKILLS